MCAISKEDMEKGILSQPTKNKFEVLFNALSLGVVMLDRNFQILEANSSMKKWFPNIADQAFSCCYDVFHPENNGVPCIECPVKKCFNDALPHSIEQVKKTSFGERYYKLVANPMVDDAGNVFAVMETLEDITGQKQYEIEILKREETIRSLISSISDIVYTLDLKQCYTGVYGAWIESTGHPAEYFYGKTPAEIFGYESDPIHSSAHEKSLKGETVVYEWSVLNNGTSTFFQTSISPIRNQFGEIIGLVGVGRDISHLKSVEREYRAIASRYQAYIDASNAGAWEYNHKTGMLQCSTQYFGILGWGNKDYDTSENLNAEHIWNTLIHPDDLVEAKGYLNYYIKQPEGMYEQIFRMLHQNGQYRWILSRGRLLNDEHDAEATILIGTHIDITEQKKSEELILAKNKELESYLYVASHDLRAPLVNIQGFSNRIKKQVAQLDSLIDTDSSLLPNAEKVLTLLHDGMPKSLSFILSNVKKMDGLINGLLTISRTGRYKMNIQLVDMNQLVEKIVHNFNFQIIENNVIVEQGDLPACYGDSTLLNQLFSNLLENAIKYRNKDRQLHVHIEGHHGNNSIIFSVKDNGQGIDPVSIHKIWDVFYRVDPNITHGDGIGLNLVAKIVEKHKGRVWVESKPGIGSTFYIQLSDTLFIE
jgi:PAS domain S-box-containing protein